MSDVAHLKQEDASHTISQKLNATGAKLGVNDISIKAMDQLEGQQKSKERLEDAKLQAQEALASLIQAIASVANLKDQKKQQIQEISDNLDSANLMLQRCLDTIYILEHEKSAQIKSVTLLQHHI